MPDILLYIDPEANLQAGDWIARLAATTTATTLYLAPQDFRELLTVSYKEEVPSPDRIAFGDDESNGAATLLAFKLKHGVRP